MLILTLRIWIRFLFGMHPYIELITYYQYQIVKKSWRTPKLLIYKTKYLYIFLKLHNHYTISNFYHISADLCYNK